MTKVNTASIAALYRSMNLRLLSKAKFNIFSSTLNLDKIVVEKMIEQIPVESTHIVISQNLLPFAWAAGIFGGRTFDVLMTRLPMQKIHERLDIAYERFPESTTLHDFRAGDRLVNAETAALNACRKIVTPHAEIAEIFNHKVIRLEWKIPVIKEKFQKGDIILFPSSSLGRKGAYEIRRLARELNLTIRFTGVASENADFWKGVTVQQSSSTIFDNVRAVVYPVYIEHQPRILLRAVACGVPVITTTAAGLTVQDRVTIVPVGDYPALKDAMLQILKAVETV